MSAVVPRARAVLLATSDRGVATCLTELLAGERISLSTCATGAEALAWIESAPVEVVLTELVLPDLLGVELLKKVGERWPGLPVLVLATDTAAPEALEALRSGAADLLQKPPDAEEVSYVLGKALAAVERRAGHPPPPSSGDRAGMLGESPAMRKVYETLERAAQSTATVLVRGENGTGKELVARAIHDASPRREFPFVKIDCASLPEQLLESELFGHERGAFTGAVVRKPGRAELADGGTLFLDEIGELTVTLQAKLLRLLQDRQIERLGGTKTIKLDIRVVAATHRDLDGMVSRGEFRQDLFFRLNVVDLWLPPLRARREDIAPLSQHFCAASGAANGKPGARLNEGALRALKAQKWPGNVRQLQNFVERLVVLSPSDELGEADVRAALTGHVHFETQPATEASRPIPPSDQVPPLATATGATSSIPVMPLDVALRSAEKSALEVALRAAKGNRSSAAKLLGISRSTLYAKLTEHGLL